eukprot:358391-Chlamydomonas_euryale.AAC.4
MTSWNGSYGELAYHRVNADVVLQHRSLVALKDSLVEAAAARSSAWVSGRHNVALVSGRVKGPGW